MARIAGNVCNTYIHIDLLVEEISTSIENNTSTVTWSLVGYMGAGGTSAQWYSNSYHTINVNINGKSVYSLANTTQKVISIGTNATQSNPTVIASGTATVPHNEDGTKNCACSFSVVYRYSSAFSWSGSGNVALTNIARATVPRLSVSSAKLGDKVTISLPRASANYTHRIDYDVKSLVSGLAGGGTSGTVTGTSYEWTVPTNLSQYFPSERSTTVTFTVTTYNGSKQVGTPQTATLKVNVPDYTPTISSVSITDPKGYLNTYGGFVQGKSNANVAITASGKYDSSIILYLANVEKGYNSTSSSITTDTLLNSGTTTATIKVVDSRSKVATVTQNITVLPYAAPVIASFNAYRCKSATDSTVDDMGEYIAVSHSTSVSSLNSKNTKTVTVQYRQAGATTWNTLSGSIFTASSDKRWEVRLTVTDKIGESAIATKEVPVAYTLLDFNASGKGMAIGKVSEGDNFDVNMEALFRSNVDFNGVVTANAQTILKSKGNQVALDYYCHQIAGDGGAGIGYFKFATITITGTYLDDRIVMHFQGRNRRIGDLTLVFSGVSTSAATALYSAYQTGDIAQIYVVKTANGVFDLYMYSNTGYDNVTITDVDMSKYMRDRLNITWHSTFTTALPSTAATIRKANDWTVSGTATGTSFSLTFNSGSAYILSLTISNGMLYLIALVPRSDGSFSMTTLAGGGSVQVSVSGTTMTCSISGGTSTTTTTYKYIELK